MKGLNIIRHPKYRTKWMNPSKGKGKSRGDSDQPSQLTVFPVSWWDDRAPATKALPSPPEQDRDAEGFYKLRRRANHG